MNAPQTQAKAIVAGILAVLFAGISALGTVVTGTQTLAGVSVAQWLYVAGAMITAGGSVYGITWSVTNAPPKVATQSTDGAYNVTSLPVSTGPALAAPVKPLVPATVDQLISGASVPDRSPAVWYPPTRTDEAPTPAADTAPDAPTAPAS